MKNFIKIVILFISLSTFSQSPWTKEKGKFYTQLSFTTIPNYDTLFGDPEYNTERETADNTIQFYGEYGITNSTSLLVNLPFKLIKTGDFVNPNLSQVSKTIEASKSALGNIEIGIKHNFYKKDWILSGQFSVEANTGSYNEDSGIRTGYDAWSFTPLFLAGKSFGKSYLQTFIGANIRTNDYSSNFKIGGEYGRKLSEKFWLTGFLDISKSFENGDVILPSANLATGLYVNDQEYGVVGVKGIYEINNKFGVNASLPAAFFGNNVAKQLAFSIGIYKKF